MSLAVFVTAITDQLHQVARFRQNRLDHRLILGVERKVEDAGVVGEVLGDVRTVKAVFGVPDERTANMVGPTQPVGSGTSGHPESATQSAVPAAGGVVRNRMGASSVQYAAQPVPTISHELAANVFLILTRSRFAEIATLFDLLHM